MDLINEFGSEVSGHPALMLYSSQMNHVNSCTIMTAIQTLCIIITIMCTAC